MKNFARLVRFAWPYRVRFFASVGCAIMVALLWFANIAAVYPLLQILVYSQNSQKWAAEKIEGMKTDSRGPRARLDEIDLVKRLATHEHPKPAELVDHYKEVYADREAKARALSDYQR